jgi:uncharacterized protein with HEPN domain
MYSELILTKLNYCLEHIEAIEKYCSDINDETTFIEHHQGLTYDGTVMRLQALGELLKSISQKHPEVIRDLNYSEIDDVIKFRDYVAHHYERLAHDIIFSIVRVNLPELKACILVLINKD